MPGNFFLIFVDEQQPELISGFCKIHFKSDSFVLKSNHKSIQVNIKLTALIL